MAPFFVLLALMALAPKFAPLWWSRHYAKLALGLAAITLTYYFGMLQAGGAVAQVFEEYLSFIALLGGLYVVAGGVLLEFKIPNTPATNVLFLLIGAMLANMLGTTGTAMLLIRPWIRLNKMRIQPYHIVFFIFLVANVGGCLAPIGDPPLFLGYLQGVPFWWVTKHCWPMWALAVGLLLAVFYAMDKLNYRQIPAVSEAKRSQWRFEGRWNLFFLALILGALFVHRPPLLREGLMLAAALGSWCLTKRSVHVANGFNFHPLKELAILFAGIFATMLPVMDWLNVHAADLLGSKPSPGTFYWTAGLLSSLLDNAPTYLAFFSGLGGLTGGSGASTVVDLHAACLTAVSIGSVFFGAATYIGNGPNLMVKALADHERIPMPSFMDLVFKYSLPILVPVLVVVWLVFFVHQKF